MKALTRILAVIGIASLCGCSSFDRDYQAMLDQPASASSTSAWAGTWQSFNGHGGNELRAILTKTAEDQYHARFRAKFWMFFHADQETDLKVTATNPIRASGQQDLGFWSGGVYEYQATINEPDLTATYKSKYDNGEFKLKRIK